MDEKKAIMEKVRREQRYMDEKSAIINMMMAQTSASVTASAAPPASYSLSVRREIFEDEQHKELRGNNSVEGSQTVNSNGSRSRLSDRGLAPLDSFKRNSQQSQLSSHSSHSHHSNHSLSNIRQQDPYMDEKQAILSQMQRQQNYMEEKHAIIAMMQSAQQSLTPVTPSPSSYSASRHSLSSPPPPPSSSSQQQQQPPPPTFNSPPPDESYQESDALIASMLESEDNAFMHDSSNGGGSNTFSVEQSDIEFALTNSARAHQPGAFASSHLAFITPPAWANPTNNGSGGNLNSHLQVAPAAVAAAAAGVAVVEDGSTMPSVLNDSTSTPLDFSSSMILVEDATPPPSRPGAYASNQPAFLRPPAWANQSSSSNNNNSSRRSNRDLETALPVSPEFEKQYRQERRLKIIGIASLLLAVVSVIGVSVGLLSRNGSSHSSGDESFNACPVNFDVICRDGIFAIPDCLQDRYDFVKTEVLPKLHPNYEKLKPCDPASIAGVALAAHDPVVTSLSYYALATLYFATQGRSWRRNVGWLETRSYCGGFHGIICDASGKFYLNLVNNFLKGTIPTEIGLLRYSLKSLKLGSNLDLEGTIPTEMGQLDFLTEFAMNDAAVEGTIPTEFGNCQKLERLSVHTAKISGSIPSELAQLSDTLGRFLLVVL